MVGYYMENAKIIREGLASLGLTVFGGVNSPYVWLKVPAGMTSWDFFDKLLHEANIVVLQVLVLAHLAKIISVLLHLVAVKTH